VKNSKSLDQTEGHNRYIELRQSQSFISLDEVDHIDRTT